MEKRTFEDIAIEEAEIIDRLFALCKKLLMDLSQYRSIEAEEKKSERTGGKNMKIDPSVWVAIAALLVSVVFGIIGATRNSNVDVKSEIEEAKKEAALSAKIETALNAIMSDTREIKSDQKSLMADVNDLKERMTKQEESLKSAWVRIDEIRGGKKNDKLEG